MILVLVRQLGQDLVHQGIRPDVMPDNRVVQGLTSELVPDHSALPLVGYSHGRNVGNLVAQQVQVDARFLDAQLNGIEQLLGVLFHPALLGRDLVHFHRMGTDLLQVRCFEYLEGKKGDCKSFLKIHSVTLLTTNRVVLVPESITPINLFLSLGSILGSWKNNQDRGQYLD